MKLREPASAVGWVARNSLALLVLTISSWTLVWSVVGWELGPIPIAAWALFFFIVSFPTLTAPSIAVIAILWFVRRRTRRGEFLIVAIPVMLALPMAGAYLIYDNAAGLAAFSLPGQFGTALIMASRPLPTEQSHPRAAQHEKVGGCDG